MPNYFVPNFMILTTYILNAIARLHLHLFWPQMQAFNYMFLNTILCLPLHVFEHNCMPSTKFCEHKFMPLTTCFEQNIMLSTTCFWTQLHVFHYMFWTQFYVFKYIFLKAIACLPLHVFEHHCMSSTTWFWKQFLYLQLLHFLSKCMLYWSIICRWSIVYVIYFGINLYL